MTMLFSDEELTQHVLWGNRVPNSKPLAKEDLGALKGTTNTYT